MCVQVLSVGSSLVLRAAVPFGCMTADVARNALGFGLFHIRGSLPPYFSARIGRLFDDMC